MTADTADTGGTGGIADTGGTSLYLWFDIDLEAVPDYPKIWKPESLKWALGVDWATVNDLVRNNPTQYPPGDHGAALVAAQAAGLSASDIEGLSSLYLDPVDATAPQVTAGGHRMTAMRRQGLRWALGSAIATTSATGPPAPSTSSTSTNRSPARAAARAAPPSALFS
jgi:hypothetical protein